METATFALGCFWSAEAYFGQVEGVECTQVGYMDIVASDSTGEESLTLECIQIQFDPISCTYEQLLQVFWQAHTPTNPPSFKQYGSVIFYHDLRQEKAARQALEREREMVAHLYTSMEPVKEFTPAEGLHQKKYLQDEPELLSLCLEEAVSLDDFLQAKAAVKLNSFVYGLLDAEQTAESVEKSKLSPDTAAKIIHYLYMLESD